ncbi:hypothetical protein [Puniceicoccus vermicola]|uniref:WG repeat-containing protein n=1 Tax=Puniceicoccus vermicola TaxID=388746 RepID=A0A7X1B104_9BACT|nr:hypothetical protein [Puniceicoccus vermicola]MBC2603474.1 hypothetical protein [Puniceicoccus vermicola]
MKTMECQYGELRGITNFMTYKSGSLKSCIVDTRNEVTTSAGTLVPQYRPPVLGERQKKYRSSLSFFENGQIKSAALDDSTPLQTPLGVFHAELVTFYEDGAVNRVFPLNGKIDGYWSEQNEGELAEVFDFDLPVGQFSAKIIALHFYPSGALKSLTLWPGEKIVLQSPVGEISARTGFALYENGSLRSLEPAEPANLLTPIGVIAAYDPEMIGMNADQNSVQFDPEGNLISVKTVHTGIKVIEEDGSLRQIEPVEAPSLIDIFEMRTVSMQVDFTGELVQIEADRIYAYNLEETDIATFIRSQVLRDACSACAGCGSGGSCGSGDDGVCEKGDDCFKNQ